MLLEIITPDKKLFSGDVVSVQLPGTNGSFGLLNNHAPIISSLRKGIIKVVTDQKVAEEFEIKGGIIELKNNKVIVLAE